MMVLFSNLLLCDSSSELDKDSLLHCSLFSWFLFGFMNVIAQSWYKKLKIRQESQKPRGRENIKFGKQAIASDKS